VPLSDVVRPPPRRRAAAAPTAKPELHDQRFTPQRSQTRARALTPDDNSGWSKTEVPQRRCSPARGSASRHSPEYLHKKIILFWDGFHQQAGSGV
jgi:hypothetical protein